MKQFQFLATVLLLFSCSPAKWATVQDMAKPASLPSGAPHYSDVCFSSRWERPRDESDTLETFQAARNFHATYLNWVYSTNADFIKKANNLGYRMQIALTPTLSDLPFGSNIHKKGRMVNKAGYFVTAPWMKGWDNWWGCVNNPGFQETYFAYIRAALDAGAYGFQVDDPAMGYLLVRNQWEDVCYCQFCQEKADSLGLLPPDIQKASVLEFHQNMKKRAESYAGRPVPFSCNNFRGEWELFPFSFFDFGVAELPERKANPEYIYAILREARRLGKAQVFSFVSDREFLIQKVIATTYACGGNQLAPWDVWQAKSPERYFGKADSFAPYYAFVRANALWLQGYEDAFYATTQDDTRYVDTKQLPVSFEAYTRQVHAFVRARPGDKNAPVVIHIVDWEVLTGEFSILLDERRFFKHGIRSVEMLTPVPFDAAAHAKAEESNDFSNMAAHRLLPFSKSGHSVKVGIPKLDMHWAILVVR
ncbi:MAG: hypothetical protein R2830_06855 [Saprospiraceae bacterium]